MTEKFKTANDIIEYANRNDKQLENLVLFVSSPRLKDGYELHGCGDNIVMGFFKTKAPYIEPVELQSSHNWYKVKDAENEKNRLITKIFGDD